MVDLEHHSVVDVLEDRSVESAKAWLQARPTIAVVSRGRCGLYAQAAREGAPQAPRWLIVFIWSKISGRRSRSR